MRPVEKPDLPALKEVIDSNELFPSELLDGMTEPYFGDPDTSDIWLTLDVDQQPALVAYCAPERMTQGTYNLYLIAVHKRHHWQGLGSKAMAFIEEMLRQQGSRILIVETSGLPDFELTRRFYTKIGYTQEAVIREFYQAGEDKVVFWKKLVQ